MARPCFFHGNALIEQLAFINPGEVHAWINPRNGKVFRRRRQPYILASANPATKRRVDNLIRQIKPLLQKSRADKRGVIAVPARHNQRAARPHEVIDGAKTVHHTFLLQ
jgi:phosphatidylserine decarboxylase